MNNNLKKNKFSVGLIGNGKWSNIIANEISKHKNFYLKAIITRNKLIPIQNCKSLKYFNFEKFIQKEHFDCLYIAANPQANYQIFKIIKNYKIPCIFEKPIFDNINNCNKFEKYIIDTNHLLLTNLPNIYSEEFKVLKKYFNKYRNKIKKIYLFEGKMGDQNSKIHPLLDWGVHSLTLIFKLFNNETMQSIELKTIKSKMNDMIYKIYINHHNIPIKILTGNGFKDKVRKLIILLENHEVIECDFNNHYLSFNNSKVYESKRTPVSLLFDNLYKKLNNNNESYENIKISLRAIKIFCQHL